MMACAEEDLNEMVVEEVGGLCLAWSGNQTFADLTHFVRGAADFFAERAFAVTSFSDGGRGAAVVRANERYFVPNDSGILMRPLDDCVCMSGRDYVRFVRDGGLADFDDVWFYDELPACGVPADVNLTGLGPWKVTDAEPAERKRAVLDWFVASGCRLAVGDGNGLNLLTASPDDLLRACGNEMLKSPYLVLRNITAR
jgi:hypothetical protein